MYDICHINTTFNMGSGSARRTIAEARFQVERGLKVAIVCGPDNDIATEQLDRLDVYFVDHLRKSLSPYADVMAALNLRRLLVGNARAVVYNTHLAKAGALHRVLPRIEGSRNIHTIHGPTFGSGVGAIKGSVFKNVEQFCNRNTDEYEFVGHELFERYASAGVCSPLKSHVIYTGKANIEALCGIRSRSVDGGVLPPEKVVRFLQIGRLVPVKQQDISIELIGRLLESDLRCELVLVGSALTDSEKGYEARLRQKVSQMGLVDHVSFTGHLADVTCELEAADICLLPSKFEGLPNVVVESVISGTPIACFDVSGVQEVLGSSLSHCVAGSKGGVDALESVVRGIMGSFTDTKELTEKRGAEIQDSYRIEKMNEMKYRVVRRLLES